MSTDTPVNANSESTSEKLLKLSSRFRFILERIKYPKEYFEEISGSGIPDTIDNKDLLCQSIFTPVKHFVDCIENAVDEAKQTSCKDRDKALTALTGLCNTVRDFRSRLASDFRGSTTIESNSIIDVYRESVKKYVQPFDEIAASYQAYSYAEHLTNEIGTRPADTTGNNTQRRKTGPKPKYSPDKAKQIKASYEEALQEDKGVKYAWNQAAKEHDIISGDAAKMACRRAGLIQNK